MVKLSEEEITNILVDYATDKNQRQAVLLDGAWGSGKSYFVENVLMKKLSEHNVTPVRVSLYGLQSRQDVQNVVWGALMQFALNEMGQSNETLGKFRDVIKKVPAPPDILTSLAKGIISQIPVISTMADAMQDTMQDTSIIAKAVEGKNFLLIFDDFERASMNPIELMGVLNDFVENSEYKTLLVADERHMFHAARQSDESLASKFAVTLQYCKMRNGQSNKDDKANEAAIKPNGTGKEKENEARKSLYKKADWLFQREDLYQVTKEKLIGLTLHYTPDFKSAFMNIVKIYIGDDSRDNVVKFVTENQMVIQQSLQGHSNLRTLIKACSAMKKLLAYVLKIKDESSHQDWCEAEALQILRQILSETVRQAQGKGLYDWSNDGARNLRYRVYRSNSAIDSIELLCDYRFVDEFLETRKEDAGQIRKDLESRIKEREERESKEKEHQERALSKLDRKWYFLSDAEIKDALDRLYEEIYIEEDSKSYYLPGEFKDILINLIEIQNPNFGGVSADGQTLSLPNERTIEEYVERMEEYVWNIFPLIENGKKEEYVQSVIEHLRQSPFSDAKGNEEYQKYIESLLITLGNYRLDCVEDELNHELPSLTEADFFVRCKNLTGHFEKMGQFLSMYPEDCKPENLEKDIQNASPTQTHNLCRAIRSVYANADAFTVELSYIEELSKELEQPKYDMAPDDEGNLVASRSKKIWMTELRNTLRGVADKLREASAS